MKSSRKRLALLWVTALVGPVALVAADAVMRRGMFAARTGPPAEGYVGGALLSLALWGFGLEAARSPRKAVRALAWVVLGLTASLGIGGQLIFRATTHEYFNREAAVFSIGLWPTIVHYLSLTPALTLAILAAPAALAVFLAVMRQRVFGLRDAFPRAISGLALLAWLIAMFGPFAVPSSKRGLPPDVLFWNAAGGLGLSVVGLVPRPRALPPGNHQRLPPPSRAVSPDAPSIVLVFGESIRRDEVCAERAPGCVKNRRIDEAAPDRIGFSRASSVASCTEIAGAILWTGLSITSSAEEMQTAPLLWDYAAALGYRTGYFTSQNLGFGDQALFIATSHIDEVREGRDRDAQVDADIGTDDEVTTAEALQFLSREGPAFVVAHLSNTHLPYRQVPGFAPYEHDGDTSKDRRARYLNSLAHHDATVGDFIASLRKTPAGKRTIIVYTADHGEAWGEHDSYTHTFDLYAEQTDVPLWIDAPEGTLTPSQRRELVRGSTSRPVLTQDVTATLLDLMGALGDPAFERFTKSLDGSTLFLPAPPVRARELSNCPPFRSCYPDAWGAVRWPLKYHYVGRVGEHVCSDIEADPFEHAPLPSASCDALRQLVEESRRGEQVSRGAYATVVRASAP